MDMHALQEAIKDVALIELCLGSNDHGEDVFAYIKVPLDRYGAFKEAVLRGYEFETSDFGEIIAEGKGHPPAALIQELKEKYRFWDGFEEKMTALGQAGLDAHTPEASK